MQLNKFEDHPNFQEFLDAVNDFAQDICDHSHYIEDIEAIKVENPPSKNFLPSTQTGIVLNIEIPLSDSYEELIKRFGLPKHVEERLSNEITFDWAYNLMSFLEYEKKDSRKISIALNNFWSGTAQDRSYVEELAYSIINQMNEKEKISFNQYRFNEEDHLRLSFEFLYDPKYEKPLHILSKINFDYPYFRSRTEIFQDSQRHNRDLLIPIAAIHCELPEDVEDFKELISQICEKTFPNFKQLKINMLASPSS